MAGLKARVEARLKAGSQAGLQTRVFPDAQIETAASISHAATTRHGTQRLATGRGSVTVVSVGFNG